MVEAATFPIEVVEQYVPSASRTRTKYSEVWKYFKITERGKAMCSKCLKVYCYSEGTTSNLKKHLMKAHNTCTNSSDKKNAAAPNPTLSDALLKNDSKLKKAVRIKRAPTEQMHMHLKILKMICKNFHPVSIVDDDGLVDLLNISSPSYKLPTRADITEALLPALYTKVSEMIGNVLQEAFAICLTADFWTSVESDSFVAVASHFIDKEWKLRSVCCGVEQLGDNTSDAVAGAIQGIIDRWNIGSKIQCIVMNSTEVARAAARLLDSKWMACFAHSLNLIVKQVFQVEEFRTVVDKVTNIIHYFKQCPQESEHLKEMQQDLKKLHHDLNSDFKTNWYLMYDTLVKYLEQRNAIIALMTEREINIESPSSQEAITLQQAISLLAPFKEAVSCMTSERHVRSSEMIYIAGILRKKTLNFAVNHTDVSQCVQNLIKTIIDSMDGLNFLHLKNDKDIALATLLDPRLKINGFLDENLAEESKAYLLEQAVAIPTLSPLTLESIIAENAIDIPSKTGSLWEDLDCRVAVVTQAHEAPMVEAQLEMKKYFEDAPLKRNEDPLLWWKGNEAIYKRLSSIAKRVLCIVGNSVPCEQMFSCSGQEMMYRRNFALSDNVLTTAFIGNNWDLVEKNNV